MKVILNTISKPYKKGKTMIKVTLLGDSIRLMGYGRYVPECLGNDFEVFQLKTNGRYAKHTFRDLYDFRNDMAGSRIIHWNNGAWDTCDLFGDGPFTSEEDYVKDMLRLADLLLARYEKVIFATSTPFKEGYEKVFSNERTARYNDLIVPLLQEKGVIINDLHAFVAENIEAFVRNDDKAHLTEEGSRACATQVADCIRRVAATLAEDGSSDRGTEANYEWYHEKNI